MEASPDVEEVTSDLDSAHDTLAVLVHLGVAQDFCEAVAASSDPTSVEVVAELRDEIEVVEAELAPPRTCQGA